MESSEPTQRQGTMEARLENSLALGRKPKNSWLEMLRDGMLRVDVYTFPFFG